MELFQTYQNPWAYRIPVKKLDDRVKFFIARRPMPTNWSLDIQDIKDNEIDVVWSDRDIVDLPRVGKMQLIEAIFAKGILND